jgi:dTDP-glucose pyrophosphorylase
MRAVILAAGRGTRMGGLTAATPKPLLEVAGRPILFHVIGGLAAAGVRQFIVVVGYLGQQIEQRLGDGSGLGVAVSYRRQERAEGTARALLTARQALAGAPFVLSWGDILVEPATYTAMLGRFRGQPCDALLAVNPVDDPWRGAAVYVDDAWRVIRIVEKPARGTSTTPWNNAGVFVLDPVVLEFAGRLSPSDRGEYELPQALAAMLAAGRRIDAIPVQGFWSDVGTPEDLRLADATFGPK